MSCFQSCKTLCRHLRHCSGSIGFPRPGDVIPAALLQIPEHLRFIAGVGERRPLPETPVAFVVLERGDMTVGKRDVHPVVVIPPGMDAGRVIRIAGWIAVISIVLCTFGGVIPAFRAAKLDPAGALRYE